MVSPVPSDRMVTCVRVLEESMGAVRTGRKRNYFDSEADRVQRHYLRKFFCKGGESFH